MSDGVYRLEDLSDVSSILNRLQQQLLKLEHRIEVVEQQQQPTRAVSKNPHVYAPFQPRPIPDLF